MNLLNAPKNTYHPFNKKNYPKKIFDRHSEHFPKVTFIYKFGIFHLSVIHTKSTPYYGWEVAYLVGMTYVVSVAATVSFQFKNTYFLTIMIYSIDYFFKEMALSQFTP